MATGRPPCTNTEGRKAKCRLTNVVNPKLFSASMRDPVCAIDGLLPHPDLHTLGINRDNLMGELLAKPKRNPRSEYATVGYMAKRIQMRKNRFQKIAESMKAARENPGPPGVPGDHGDHAPKQTEVRFKVHDPKAHSKGGTLENTINGRADEEAPPAPQHLIHPGKDISKLYGTPCTHNAIRYRQIFPHRFSRMLRVLQLDVLDHLSPHQ
ncbi:hypothetical protein PV326_008604 [Microctonus aethiopoides]|nr:hypothetical protein PV326_008604 [Microctonus aethiopoides]